MCYHLSSPGGTDLQIFEKDIVDTFKEIYHVSGFTRPYLPVTLNNNSNSIESARWKIAPVDVHSENEMNKLKPYYLNSTDYNIWWKHSNEIFHQRGLLYVNGFFEPHYIPGQTLSDNYYIYLPEKEIFTLGIIWSEFQNHDTGEVYPTFSIITTSANSLMEKIHNTTRKGPRMPLIIPENNRDTWLFAEGKDSVQELMKPYDGKLNSHRVYRVTGAIGEKTNVPEIQNPI